MSREQWGHGYWQGVKDAREVEALKDWSQEEIELITEYCISEMYYCRNCVDFDYEDRSGFAVSRFYAVFGGRDRIDECVLDVIYDYIADYGPYNTAITGPIGKKNIAEDEIRVYSAKPPEEFASFEEWNANVRERMKPIFKKIHALWWTRHGIGEA